MSAPTRCTRRLPIWPGELIWPGTWKDRAGRDRGPVIPGHEVSGEVAELGMGTTGLTVGQRVFDHAGLRPEQTVLVHGPPER